MKFKLFLFILTACPFMVKAQGIEGAKQVGIGTSTPNISAKLEINSTSKGFLPPRITLTSTSDVATIASPATGLLIYNTATAGVSPSNVVPGYYYYDGSKWQRIINQTPSATIEFSVNADPNTIGTTFNGTAASKDYVYVSKVDNKQWTYNGSTYVSYTVPNSSSWYLKKGTSDAGSNKTDTIYRYGNVGIGNPTAGTALEVGSTTGLISGVLTINPENTSTDGGQITIKKSPSGSTSNWTIDQYVSNSTPRFRIFPGADETKGISIGEGGKVGIGTTTVGQTEKLYVDGTVKITDNLNAKGAYYVVAGLSADEYISNQASDKLLPLSAKDDPNGWWKGLYKYFQPDIAGYYFITASGNWKIDQTNYESNVKVELFFKKNSTTEIANCQSILPTSETKTQNLTCIVYLNGSTDYIELKAKNYSTGKPVYVTGEGNQTWTKLEAYKMN